MCSIAKYRQQRTTCHPAVFWSVAWHTWLCQMTVVGDLRQESAGIHPTSTAELSHAVTWTLCPAVQLEVDPAANRQPVYAFRRDRANIIERFSLSALCTSQCRVGVMQLTTRRRFTVTILSNQVVQYTVSSPTLNWPMLYHEVRSGAAVDGSCQVNCRAPIAGQWDSHCRAFERQLACRLHSAQNTLLTEPFHTTCYTAVAILRRQHLRNALFDALHQLYGTHYQKLFLIVTL